MLHFSKTSIFIIFIISIIITCSVPNQISASSTIAEVVRDISPRELPGITYRAPAKTKDNQYIKTYNQAIHYYNNRDFAKASYLLGKLSTEYRDGGSALFLLGTCYYRLHENEKAIQTLIKASVAGYKSNEIQEYLYYCLTAQGEAYLNQKDYRMAIANYKKALQYGSEPAILNNTVFAYIELAKNLKKSDRVPMLLYAYQFVKNHNYQSETIGILAGNLANYILNPPAPEYYDQVIGCLQAALSYSDDPYLHYTKGFIYLYQNQTTLAKNEFKTVIDNYPASKYYQASLDSYLDLGKVRYRHQLIYPVRVSAGNADITSLEAKLLIQVPQSYSLQKVFNQRVEFNNKPVPYQIVTDNFGVRYLELRLKGNFIEGWNELSVQSELELEQQRMDQNYLAKYKLTDYRQNDPKYKLLTTRSGIIDINNPQIQKMAAEIRQNSKGANLLDLVRGVYYYVINFLEYKTNNGPLERVSVERALKNPDTAVCEDYAAITVALLRALKIPASYFSGDIYQKTTGHAWAVWYTPDYRPIPLDTTWGDTSGNPDLYFLWFSCLPITRSFTCESNLMPGSTSISINTISNQGISIDLGDEKVKIERLYN